MARYGHRKPYSESCHCGAVSFQADIAEQGHQQVQLLNMHQVPRVVRTREARALSLARGELVLSRNINGCLRADHTPSCITNSAQPSAFAPLDRESLSRWEANGTSFRLRRLMTLTLPSCRQHRSDMPMAGMIGTTNRQRIRV